MSGLKRGARMSQGGGSLWLAFFLLVVPVTLTLYANTLSVPWYFDDYRAIVDNPMVRDLSASFDQILGPRGIPRFSFALNYAIAGLALEWFHLTNIAIHLGCVLLVVLLLRECYPGSTLWPLWGGILFAVHPLQTQAVNYVVQRMALLATFFFLGAVLAYVKGRRRQLSAEGAPTLAVLSLYAISLLCAVGAFLSKENTVVLPAMLLLIDYCLFGKSPAAKIKVKWVVLPLLALAAYPVYLHFSSGNLSIGLPDAGAEHFVLPEGAAASFAVAQPENLSLRYLLTEFTVFWVYVKLFLLPLGQVFDYCYPLVNSLFDWKSLLALAALLGALLAAACRREKDRLLFLGAVWIPLALLVESTLIPLDTVVEHRTYLPMFGFILVSTELLFRKVPGRFLAASLLTVGICLSLLTFTRNALWARPIDFWADNVSKVPHSYRPVVGLADEYLRAGRYDEAASAYRRALSMNPYNPEEVHANLGKAYIELKQPALAIRELEQAVDLGGAEPHMAPAFSNLGALLVSQKRFDEGVGYLEQAVALNPANAGALMNLGVAYEKAGRFDRAETVYRKALSLNSANTDAHFALGYLLIKTGRPGAAVSELAAARELAPGNPGVLYYYGLALLRSGDGAAARGVLPMLQALDRHYFEKLGNVIEGR